MKYIFIFFIAVFVSCNTIESGDRLSKSDISRIEKLYDLDKSETIIQFYSEFKNSVAGNFYTERRVASYWIDEEDLSKNEINSAYYSEIIQIDTVIYAGATYSPYLKITKVDNSSFKVCFDGEKTELRKIFSDVLSKWNLAKKKIEDKKPTNHAKSDCIIDHFFENNDVPQLAKDIYLDNDWNLCNENEALALLDSLTTKSKVSRSFYFKVLTKSEKKADGYYSEGLGHAGYEFVENHTQEFASFFENKQCHTDSDLETWAGIVIMEFSIREEGRYDKPLVDDYIRKLKTNCKNCSTAQKETINKFGLELKEKWSEFLKQIN